MMSGEVSQNLVEVRQDREVTVVRFARRTILDPVIIEAVGERLLDLVRQEQCRRLVLDFSQVESLTSSMLGKFVALHNAIEADGGRLVFSGVGPFLRQIFQVCKFPETIPLLPDEKTAIVALTADSDADDRNRQGLC